MIQLGARKFADWNPAFFGRKSVWDWHLILDRGKSHSQNIAIASEIIKSYPAERSHVGQPDADELREAVALACQPQNAGRIVQGRNRVAAMPREWVLANVEAIARSVLDFGDYWEYGRYLELLDHLGAHDKVSALVAEGLKSADADVRDMAELWSTRGGPAAG